MRQVACPPIVPACLALLSSAVVGCSRSVAESASPAVAAAPPALTARPVPREAPGPPPATPSLPADCAEGPPPCYPPPGFVSQLCRGKYPGVAIVMFGKDQPWKHAFVKVREVFPVNAFAGPVTHVPLLFSEEVVLLRHRPYVPRPGYDMDNPDSFDVLRASGTCATLAEDQIRERWAGPSIYAPLAWSWIDPGLRQALAGCEKVDAARRKQEEICSGRYIGGGSPACQQASVGLVQAIIAEVDRGLVLPRPSAIPDWTQSAR